MPSAQPLPVAFAAPQRRLQSKVPPRRVMTRRRSASSPSATSTSATSAASTSSTAIRLMRRPRRGRVGARHDRPLASHAVRARSWPRPGVPGARRRRRRSPGRARRSRSRLGQVDVLGEVGLLGQDPAPGCRRPRGSRRARRRRPGRRSLPDQHGAVGEGAEQRRVVRQDADSPSAVRASDHRAPRRSTPCGPRRPARPRAGRRLRRQPLLLQLLGLASRRPRGHRT